MKMRGLGRVYQPVYTDKKTGKRKQSAIWWIQYSFRGTKYRESSGSARQVNAIRLLKRRLSETSRGRLVGPDAERTTLENLAEMLFNDYRVNGRKSLPRAENAVQHLQEFFGLSRAVDITADQVTAYICLRQDQAAMPATIRYELACLKRMFTLALRAGRVEHRPYIPTIEVHNIRQGFFEEPEFRTVFSHLPKDIQPVIEFAYLTGWRGGEILSLQWWQVDFQVGIVRLEPGTTKNDEGRIFPFAPLPQLEDLLRRQREYTEALQHATGTIIPWVFHRDGKPIRDFRGAWGTACKKAGLQGRIPHDFRRTAVRNLERAGVPRSVAMKLVGHKTESIYRRYAIVSEADLSEGVAKLATLHQAGQGAPRKVVPLAKRTGKVRAKSKQISQ